MKLINYLTEVVESFDGELFSEELEETMYSFVWNNDDKIILTEEGKNKFKNVLNSEIKVIENGNIMLLDKNLSQEEYELFLKACAGFVSCLDYDKWFDSAYRRRYKVLVSEVSQ
jgi:hypothetical protein